ncbi:MAG: hypothetical protein CMO55_26880 [Verrucomicrobiales bacterium]|nr:hypothetical protein [Verrucomicrobiales bacterium]
MRYTVEQIAEDRESFAPYRYRILKNGNEFAIFTHNYRGECERIQSFKNGFEEDPPFGMSSSFLTGGGPYPLGLTKAAESYLDQLSQKFEIA